MIRVSQCPCPEVSNWKRGENLPLLGHHEDTLYEQALQDLRANSLEETQKTFMLDNELHHLDETLKWLALSLRGGL